MPYAAVATGRSLRAAWASLVPTWLANIPGLRNLYVTGYAICALGDCLREIANQGRYAAFPGAGDPSANPLIAQSRGLLQGPNEPNAAFAARAVAFRTAWRKAGAPIAVAQNIQGFLNSAGNLGAGVLPVVRVVDRENNWAIANADGSTFFTNSPWNWDGVLPWDDGTGPKYPAVTSGYVSDFWIIIAPPSGTTPIFSTYTGTSDPAWLANAGRGNGVDLGGGQQIPRAYVSGILSIIKTWKGGHMWVRNVIWAGNATDYAPAASVLPNGTYGNWSYNSAASNAQIPGRGSTPSPLTRYWDIQGGSP